MTATSEAIESALLRMAGELEPGKLLDPGEAACATGPHPDLWGPLMDKVRRAAVKLALEQIP